MRPRLLALFALVLACRGAPPPAAPPALAAGLVRLTEAQLQTARVTVDTVRLDSVAVALEVPGTISTPDLRTSHVGSIVEGRVEEVYVLPGDRVRAGQALVAIHTHEVAHALRDLRTAEAQVRFAAAALRRSETLLASEAVAREEVERRRMALEEAEAERARAREIVEHLNPNDHNDAVMQAPQGGTVFTVHARRGQAVRVGDLLVDLGDASRLWVTGFIPEVASRFRAGQQVSVAFDALPGVRVAGRIVRLGAAVDSLRRAIEVRVELAGVPDGVRPGMFGTMLLPAAVRELRAVLPADAVQRTAEGEAVFVQEGPGLFRLRLVASEPVGQGMVAVTGLAPGTPVVVGGAYHVRARLEAAPGLD